MEINFGPKNRKDGSDFRDFSKVSTATVPAKFSKTFAASNKFSRGRKRRTNERTQARTYALTHARRQAGTHACTRYARHEQVQMPETFMVKLSLV